MGDYVTKIIAKPETTKAIADLFAKGAGVHGTNMDSEMGNAIEFMAAQVEFTAELIAAGHKVKPANLALLLAQKGLSITDLSKNDYVKCGGAMTSLAISAQLTAATAATTGPGAILPAVMMVADMYMTAKDCAPAAAKSVKEITEKVSNEVNRYDWSDEGIRHWISKGHF
ncbi:MAG: hypothetical protein AAF479_10070 [Pseudomonadota bacterium]